MSLRVHYEILNQKGTPAFFSDTYANRPAFGYQGRVFISTDTGQIFEDTGSAWTLIADAGVGGGTLASVCANGNTTSTGILITAGNLGIGTSTAGAPLDIHGTGTLVYLNGTGTNNAYLLFQNAGTGKWRIGNTYNAGANSFHIYNNGLATNALSFSSTTNEAIFSGSVGIGSGTNPTFSLDVVGNTRITGQLNAFASGSGNGLYVQGISNQAAARIIGDSTTSNSYGLTIQAGTNATDSPLTITNYATSSTFLKITGAGNVGIGTNSPSFSAGTGIYINSATRSNLNLTDGTNNFLFFQDTTDGYINLQSSGSIIFRNSTSNTERIRLTSSGYFKASNSGTYFAVSGLSHELRQTAADQWTVIVTNSTSSPNGILIKYDGSAPNTGSSYDFLNCQDSSATRLRIYSNGNVANVTGSYASLSDIRLKENVIEANNKLDKLMKVRVVNYNLIGNELKQIGVIAQELEQIFPSLVEESIDKNNLEKTKYVKYSIFIPILIKAIQELNNKLERNNIN